MLLHLIKRNGTVMFIRRNLQDRGNCIAGVVMMLAIAPASLGQTTSNQENEPASSDSQEEIIVYGKKSLVSLRRELYAAEEDFVAEFNLINTNDNLDFKCEYVVYLGDRRRHHQCMPRFASRIEADMTMDMILSGQWYADASYSLRGKRYERLLLEEILRLMREHQELQDAYSTLANARDAYETERATR